MVEECPAALHLMAGGCPQAEECPAELKARAEIKARKRNPLKA
jgi:hypothetical protein